jgi:hypothetical protein
MRVVLQAEFLDQFELNLRNRLSMVLRDSELHDLASERAELVVLHQ